MSGPSRPRVAVITGGHTPLTAALAAELALRGLRVVEICRDPAMANGLDRICADPTDSAAMRALAVGIEADHGPVGILINTDGIHLRHDFLTSPAETACMHVHVNLCGQINATAAFLAVMLERGRGRIVTMIDPPPRDALPGDLGYEVALAGLHHFSRAVAVELAGRMPDIVTTLWQPGQGDLLRLARWGAALALNDDPRLHGATVIQDRQIIPPRSLRRRLADRLLLKPPIRPIILSPDPSRQKEAT